MMMAMIRPNNASGVKIAATMVLNTEITTEMISNMSATILAQFLPFRKPQAMKKLISPMINMTMPPMARAVGAKSRNHWGRFCLTSGGMVTELRYPARTRTPMDAMTMKIPTIISNMARIVTPIGLRRGGGGPTYAGGGVVVIGGDVVMT